MRSSYIVNRVLFVLVESYIESLKSSTDIETFHYLYNSIYIVKYLTLKNQRQNSQIPLHYNNRYFQALKCSNCARWVYTFSHRRQQSFHWQIMFPIQSIKNLNRVNANISFQNQNRYQNNNFQRYPQINNLQPNLGNSNFHPKSNFQQKNNNPQPPQSNFKRPLL